MTRILYWNINNFSLPKIFVAGPPAAAGMAAIRNNYIVNLVMTGPGGGPPDIIVVVEVYSRVREVGLEGTVLNPARGAGAGVLRLLGNLRNALGNQWCVVPPLNLGELGQREAVAVFYDSNNLQFTGPNLFYDRFPGEGGTVVGQAQPVNADTNANITDYPLPWLNGLPNPDNPIVALQHNRTHNFTIDGVVTPINEWQLAGQWEYYRTPPVRPIPSPIPPPYPLNRIFFPYSGCRGPFWTQFSDLTVMGAARFINLFTVHTSPSSARQGVIQLQDVREIMNPVPADQVNVILGDFNVDTFGAGASAYTGLIPAMGNYTMELDPRSGHAGAIVPNRKPYCMTHLLPVGSATPFNTNGGYGPDPTHNVYPRYGYMGSSFPNINDSGAIDNILTWYGGGTAVGPSANMTVVNTIVGTPYNALAAPAGVTAELRNGLPYASTMGHAIPQPAGVNPPGMPAWFDLVANYGQIRDTSDHLPLLIDI